MKTESKIKSKGYKVSYNMGYRNGVQVITSVTARKGMTTLTDDNITKLYNRIKG